MEKQEFQGKSKESQELSMKAVALSVGAIIIILALYKIFM